MEMVKAGRNSRDARLERVGRCWTRRVSASFSHVEGFDSRIGLYCSLSPSTIMSFAGYDVGDAWGAPEPVTSGDIVADAMRKEKIIKSVSALQALTSANLPLCV